MFQVTAVSQVVHDDVLRDFQANLPRQPYASNNLERDGIWRQSRRDAIRCKHIQHNGGLVTWLTFDCDHDAAVFPYRDGVLPPPNIITLNPDNGREHLNYRLLAPVAKTDAGRERPLRYLAAIETGMNRQLDADPGYVGLVTKNPSEECGIPRIIRRIVRKEVWDAERDRWFIVVVQTSNCYVFDGPFAGAQHCAPPETARAFRHSARRHSGTNRFKGF